MSVLFLDSGLGPCVCRTRLLPFDLVCVYRVVSSSAWLIILTADYNSVFPAGGTIAAAWDRGTWYQRGFDMGSEFRGKGIDVQLGPVVGPIGRSPEGGRNWEGTLVDGSFYTLLYVSSWVLTKAQVSVRTQFSQVSQSLRRFEVYRMLELLLVRSITLPTSKNTSVSLGRQKAMDSIFPSPLVLT
jgi:hypothetical protein